MSLFLYNLAKCGKSIDIEHRDNKIINGLPTEVFTPLLSAIKAIIKTVSGVSVFDSTNTLTVITHKILIDYNENVTAEKWINYKGKRIRIVTHENCAENDGMLILMCTERGTDGKVVNSA